MRSAAVAFAVMALSLGVASFDVVDHESEPLEPRVGGKVLLKCRSNSWFEYCTWRHKDRVCEFEWKRSHRAVKKQTCTALGNRSHFVGTYESHECYIEISDLTVADSGEWSCEMEQYVGGPLRGSVDKATVRLNVRRDPTTTTTTTAPQTTAAENEAAASTPVVFPEPATTTDGFSKREPLFSDELDPVDWDDASFNKTDFAFFNNGSEAPTIDRPSSNGSSSAGLAEKVKRTVPILVGVTAALLAVLVGSLAVALRHRRKYRVAAPVKEEGREFETEDEDEGQVKYIKKTGKLELSPLTDIDLEENQMPTSGAYLNPSNALC